MEQLRAEQRRQASRARHQQHSSDQRSRRLANYEHHGAGRVGHRAAAQGISAVTEASLFMLALLIWRPRRRDDDLKATHTVLDPRRRAPKPNVPAPGK